MWLDTSLFKECKTCSRSTDQYHIYKQTTESPGNEFSKTQIVRVFYRDDCITCENKLFKICSNCKEVKNVENFEVINPYAGTGSSFSIDGSQPVIINIPVGSPRNRTEYYNDCYECKNKSGYLTIR